MSAETHRRRVFAYRGRLISSQVPRRSAGDWKMLTMMAGFKPRARFMNEALLPSVTPVLISNPLSASIDPERSPVGAFGRDPGAVLLSVPVSDPVRESTGASHFCERVPRVPTLPADGTTISGCLRGGRDQAHNRNAPSASGGSPHDKRCIWPRIRRAPRKPGLADDRLPARRLPIRGLR